MLSLFRLPRQREHMTCRAPRKWPQQQQPRYLLIFSRHQRSSYASVDTGIACTTATTASNNTSTCCNNIATVTITSTNAATFTSTARVNNHTLPQSRSKSIENNSNDDVEHVLEAVSVCLSIGNEEWQVVAQVHSVESPTNQ